MTERLDRLASMGSLMSDGPVVIKSTIDAVLYLDETVVQFNATDGEQVMSATFVEGCFLVGTDKRVAEWSTEKGWRTLAHAEDCT